MITQYDNTPLETRTKTRTSPHPLHSQITIFNIHNNSNFTTHIINNNTYFYYDSRNFRPTHLTHRMHTTLCQLYSGLPIAPPLFRHTMPYITIKSTSRQTDGWSCEMENKPRHHLTKWPSCITQISNTCRNTLQETSPIHPSQ